MAAVGRTDDGGHGAGGRDNPGGRQVGSIPAGGAGRVGRQARAGALSSAGLVAATFFLALVLAAPAGAATAAGRTVKVSSAKVAGVGTVLTTSSGLTLYRFTKDSPGTSTCTGACASIWPPLLAPKGAHVSGPHGVQGLSLLKVGNGHWQVAFHKLPLYRFEGDKKKGQAHGQDVEGVWFAALKSGVPAAPAAPAAPSTPTSGASTTQPVPSTTPAPRTNATPAAPAPTPAPAPTAVTTAPTQPATPVTQPPAPPTTTPPTSPPPTTTPTSSAGGGGYGY